MSKLKHSLATGFEITNNCDGSDMMRCVESQISTRHSVVEQSTRKIINIS
jgi:hypothetical protein